MSKTTEKYKNESEQLAVALFRVETLGQIEKCLTEENASLITTIESQQQDLLKEVEGHTYTAQLFSNQMQENEQLKALVESQKEEIVGLRHRDRVVSLTNETLGRYVREGKEEIEKLKYRMKRLVETSVDITIHESLQKELEEQQEISHGFHQLTNKYHRQIQEGEK